MEAAASQESVPRPHLSQAERNTFEDMKAHKVQATGQVWGHRPVVPAPGRRKQEDKEFKAILGYVGNLKLAWAT